MTTNALERFESDASPEVPENNGADAQTVYCGERDPARPVGEEVRVTADGDPLAERQDFKNHSPTGFEFGYGGSGPAQLALAVLAHHADDDTALREYGAFKREVIAELPGPGDGAATWTLTTAEIEAFRTRRSEGGERR